MPEDTDSDGTGPTFHGVEPPPLPFDEAAMSKELRRIHDTVDKVLRVERTDLSPFEQEGTRDPVLAGVRTRLGEPLHATAGLVDDLSEREKAYAAWLLMRGYAHMSMLSVEQISLDLAPEMFERMLPPGDRTSAELEFHDDVMTLLARSKRRWLDRWETTCMRATIEEGLGRWCRFCSDQRSRIDTQLRRAAAIHFYWPSREPARDSSSWPGPAPPGPARCWLDSAPQSQPEPPPEPEHRPIERAALLLPGPGSPLDEAPLLEPERSALRRWIARALEARHDVAVVPRDESRPQPDVWLAQAQTFCAEDGCGLRVHMRSTQRRVEPPPDEEALRAGVPYDVADPDAWHAAATRMRWGSAQEVPPRGRGETIEAMRRDFVLSFGAWVDRETPREAVDTLAPQISECAERGRITDAPYEVVLAIDTDGRVDDHYIRAPDAHDAAVRECVAEQLRGLRFESGVEGPRRIRARLRLLPDPSPRKRYGRLHLPSGVRVAARNGTKRAPPLDVRVLMDTPHVRERLAECHADEFGDETTTTALSATFRVSRSGRTRGVRLTPPPEADEPPAAYRRCVQRALRRYRWPAPRTGKAVELNGTVCTFRE